MLLTWGEDAPSFLLPQGPTVLPPGGNLRPRLTMRGGLVQHHDTVLKPQRSLLVCVTRPSQEGPTQPHLLRLPEQGLTRAWSGSRVKGVPCRLLRGRGCHLPAVRKNHPQGAGDRHGKETREEPEDPLPGYRHCSAVPGAGIRWGGTWSWRGRGLSGSHRNAVWGRLAPAFPKLYRFSQSIMIFSMLPQEVLLVRLFLSSLWGFLFATLFLYFLKDNYFTEFCSFLSNINKNQHLMFND